MKLFTTIATVASILVSLTNAQNLPACPSECNADVCEQQEGQPKPPYIRVKLVRNDLSGNAQVAQLVEDAFNDAAARWSEVILTDLPDITVRNNVNLQNRCGVAGAIVEAGETVENVLIFAEVRNIDGPGSILGQAGACIFSQVGNNFFPRVGTMTFDSSDVIGLLQRGTFDGTVLHEMGHIIGIGQQLWRNNVINQNSNNPTYNGNDGLRGFQAIGGNQNTIPVENVGGGGTRLAHWRTSVFGNELMTGFLSGNEQPLSQMTIGSLKDLNYEVDETKFDAFQVPGSAGRRLDEARIPEHDHRHLDEDSPENQEGWEVDTTPDLTNVIPSLGPDGEYEISSSALTGVPDDSESSSGGGVSVGVLVGACAGSVFAALVGMAAFQSRREQQRAKINAESNDMNKTRSSGGNVVGPAYVQSQNNMYQGHHGQRV